MRNTRDTFGYSREYGSPERHRRNRPGNNHSPYEDSDDDFYGQFPQRFEQVWYERGSDSCEGKFGDDYYSNGRFPTDRQSFNYHPNDAYEPNYREEEDEQGRNFSRRYEDERYVYSRLGRGAAGWREERSWHGDIKLPHFEEDRRRAFYGDDNWAHNGNRGNAFRTGRRYYEENY